MVRHIVDLRGSLDECSERMLVIDKSIDSYDARYNGSNDGNAMGVSTK